MNPLIPGQVIHVVLDSGPGVGQIRPAMVIQVVDEEQRVVEANVLTLGKRDGLSDENPVKVLYTRYAGDWRLGSWHWPGEEKRVKGEEGKGEMGKRVLRISMS